MYRAQLSLTVCLLILSLLPQVMAQQVAVDWVKGEGDVSGLRLGYRPYELHYQNLPLIGDAAVYFELSANYWEYGNPTQHQTGLALALSPVISKPITTLWGRPLSWEFGIGMSLVSRKQFAGKNIGSHYQFEDRLGLTYPLDDSRRHQLAVRYMHYSNGGLSSDNPGLDFFNLSYAYRI